MGIPSTYVLGFEIGQRESVFYSEQTDRITESQNHGITEPSSTVLLYRLPELLIFSLEIIPFLIKFQIFFKINTLYSLTDFDVIFSIQTSEFIKSLDFQSHLFKKIFEI